MIKLIDLERKEPTEVKVKLFFIMLFNLMHTSIVSRCQPKKRVGDIIYVTNIFIELSLLLMQARSC